MVGRADRSFWDSVQRVLDVFRAERITARIAGTDIGPVTASATPDDRSQRGGDVRSGAANVKDPASG
jgi:hypothetical protein